MTPTKFPQFGLIILTLMSLGDWSLKCFFVRLILVLNLNDKIMSVDDLSEIIKDFLVDCRCRFYNTGLTQHLLPHALLWIV